MKKTLLLCLLICIGILYFYTSKNKEIPQGFRKISVGSQSLSVEVADTSPKITKGLSDRDVLGSDGMLFVLPTRTQASFWMKGMRFPLDFVWIDGNSVVDLTEHVLPEIGVGDANLRVYRPKVPVTHVLELPAGDIQKRAIKIGDSVVF